MSSMFKLVLAAVVGIMVLSVGMCSAETVDTGHRGVFVTYGEPTGQVAEGLHFTNPFTTSLIEMDVRQLKRNATTEAYTKDVQQASVRYSLTYSLRPDKVLFTYQTIGREWAAQQVPQVVEQSIKDVFGQSEAVKDAINNRARVQARIRNILTRELAKRYIVVHGFELRDISFSPAFEKAVEAKQVAVENANAARNKTVEIRERAAQRVIAAEAEAQAMRIQSAALASNAALVEWEAVKKWDGRLPQNMYGGGAMPFVNVR